MSDFQPPITATEDGGREQVWQLPTDTDSLLKLVTILFEDYWDEMWFGLLIEGSALEVAAPNKPQRISMYDGYVTVDFGRWHFHLCLGEHTETTPELARIRRCGKAEMYRRLTDDGWPFTWGIRLFNGRGEQMICIMLPCPFLTNHQQLVDEPVWEKLEAWDRVRKEFLGLEPDALDRTGHAFSNHG